MILEARAILDTDKIERLTKRVKDDIKRRKINTEFMCGASLALHLHGLLGPMDNFGLCDLDLSPFPVQHLVSMASCATGFFLISSVSGCDLVSLLTSLKCRELVISWQSLGREETQALVNAMESGVEKVVLWIKVTLDIEALIEYSGQGVCKCLELKDDTKNRYREEIGTWARSRNWTFKFDERCFLRILNEEMST